MAVLGAPQEGPEDEHVKGALEKFQVPVVRVLGHGM
jgi:hypothetical protein